MDNPEYQPGDYVIIVDAGGNYFRNGWIGKLIDISDDIGWDINFFIPESLSRCKTFAYTRRFRHATNRELKEYGI